MIVWTLFNCIGRLKDICLFLVAVSFYLFTCFTLFRYVYTLFQRFSLVKHRDFEKNCSETLLAQFRLEMPLKPMRVIFDSHFAL